jgi:hypothetical protein
MSLMSYVSEPSLGNLGHCSWRLKNSAIQTLSTHPWGGRREEETVDVVLA